MRQLRRKEHRRIKLPLIILGVVLLLTAIILFLIFRGAKVKGPDEGSSSSVTIGAKAPANKNTGTYTGKGLVTTASGARRTIRVYLRLKKDTYVREIVDETTPKRHVTVDSGTYTKLDKTLTLTTSKAAVATYRDKSAMSDATPTKLTQYGGTHKDFTDNMMNVLNNVISLQGKKPHTYRYLNSKLTLKDSTHQLQSVKAFVADQTVSGTSSGGSQQASSGSQAGSTNGSDNAASRQLAQQVQQAREQLKQAGIDASQFSDRQIANGLATAQRTGQSLSQVLGAKPASSSSSSSQSSSTGQTASQAQAAVAARFPADSYDIAFAGKNGDSYTFTVTNKKTGQKQSVVVSTNAN